MRLGGADGPDIVILGAPRSGTTLLRVLLGSHSRLLALPETPWLLGSYGREASLRGLVDHLVEHRRGAVANMRDVESADVLEAARAFVRRLVERPLRRSGARRLVFKTPDDVFYLDALVRLFPNAHYVHIVRDGRDVTLSTMASFTALNHYGRATPAACLRRWVDYESRIRAREDIVLHRLRFEELVAAPEATLAKLCAFLGLDFERGMMAPNLSAQDLPAREVGARDVCRRAGRIEPVVGRWRTVRLDAEQKRAFNDHASDLARFGYPPHRFHLGLKDRLALAAAAIRAAAASGRRRPRG